MEEKQKKPVYKKWWFWVIVILVIGVIGSSMGEESDTTDKQVETKEADSKETEAQEVQEVAEETTEETEEETEKETKPSPEEIKAEYIASAKTFKYTDLERSPDEYKGEVAKFTGQVIQVSEGFLDNVIYRVNVTKNPEYNEESFLEDEWIDTIYVSYKRDENEQRVLEDDIITIYGALDGLETYTSVMAGKISIPSVKAEYIDIE